MAWNSVWPVGTSSVKANRSTGAANTTYIKTTMNVDHHWNDDTSALDGHHQFVQMPKADSGGTPTAPSLAGSMDLVTYAMERTAIQSEDNTDVQPEAINAWGAMQLLGIRAMGLFNISTPGGGGSIVQNANGDNWEYAFNLTSITRTAEARYTVAFDTNMPTNNYLVYVMGVTVGSNNRLLMTIPSATTLTDSKSTAMVKLEGWAVGSKVLREPQQCWFVCFGG